MIDTNTLTPAAVSQALQDAGAIRAQVQMNWPAICAAAIWLRVELRNFNNWLAGIYGHIVAAGGVKKIWSQFFNGKAGA